MICGEGSFEPDRDVKVYKDQSEYNAIRHLLGILEGSKEVANNFPLNINMHHLNGVSFDKGCYIGQELTQRTFHTGVIRKIALPFLKFEHDQVDIDVNNYSPL